MSAPAQDPRVRAAPNADSTTAAPQLRDASPAAPRLPDHGPLDDSDFARVVREPLKVGHADRRVLAAAKISAGSLNTFLRALRTLVTHGTNAICSCCRKPRDVWNESRISPGRRDAEQGFTVRSPPAIGDIGPEGVPPPSLGYSQGSSSLKEGLTWCSWRKTCSRWRVLPSDVATERCDALSAAPLSRSTGEARPKTVAGEDERSRPRPRPGALSRRSLANPLRPVKHSARGRPAGGG